MKKLISSIVKWGLIFFISLLSKKGNDVHNTYGYDAWLYCTIEIKNLS